MCLFSGDAFWRGSPAPPSSFEDDHSNGISVSRHSDQKELLSVLESLVR